MLQSRNDSLREGNTSVPQKKKESLKDSSGNSGTVVAMSPPRRKDSDRLPSLPPQRDDGYEAVEMRQRPSQPKPVEGSSSEYLASPSRPPKPPGSSNTTASNKSRSQQTTPSVMPGRSSSSSTNAYETVEIFRAKQEQKDFGSADDSSFPPQPPRPPKPGSFSETQTDGGSSIYQQPRAAISITSRDDVYDNVHIKNIPLSPRDGQTLCGNISNSGVIENDVGSLVSKEIKTDEETMDGKLELDSGGMGCVNIESAMEERRQILKETQTKEGVVLLSVQKVIAKSSDQPSEIYGMCLMFRNSHTHPCVSFVPFLLFSFFLFTFMCGGNQVILSFIFVSVRQSK